MNYECAGCQEQHRETPKPDFKRTILNDRCSAQYRQESGGWRVCHAPFSTFGGPHVIGKARLCAPCWDRQVLGPAARAYGLDKSNPAVQEALREASRRMEASK